MDGKVFQVYNRKVKMKPTSNFKLPKSTKMLLDNILDPHLRGSMRRDYIKAILENQVKAKSNKKDRNQTNDE